MPNSTEIIQALKDTIAHKQWGYIRSCPLCQLFDGDCEQCYEVLSKIGTLPVIDVWHEYYCVDWRPNGYNQEFTASEYWDDFINPKEREYFRKTANKAIREYIKQLTKK